MKKINEDTNKEMIDLEIKFHKSQITTYIIMFIGSLSLLGLGSCVLFLYGLSTVLSIVLGSLIPNCIWTFTLLRISLTDYNLLRDYKLSRECKL